MTDVALQVIAFNEPEEKLARTFQSVNEQQVDRRVNVSTEAWITPASQEDPSFDFARDNGFEPFTAGKGKLTARNQAHDHAVDDGADIIVTLDADAPMVTTHSLASLVRPLRDGAAAFANSMPVSHPPPHGKVSAFGMAVDVGGRLEDAVFPHAHGQCSAFTARAWREAGPFDTDLDQTDSVEVRQEEEFDFLRRVKGVGRATMPKGAKVYNDPRRHLCRFPVVGSADYCEERGVETFGDEYPD